MKRLVLPLAIAALALGASSTPDANAATGSATAIAADSTPCDRPVPANSGEWKLVEITNVTFCVPADWRVSANQARTRGNTIRWGSAVARQPITVSSASGGMSRTSIASAGTNTAGTTMARRVTENEVIGGQMANVWYEEGTGRVATGVSFTERPFAISGEASGRANVDLQLAIYRTIRFTN